MNGVDVYFVFDFFNLNLIPLVNYDLNKTKYIGTIFAKNERMAKYFFLRDQFGIEINSANEALYINEILDQCIDWSEFWRLLVIKKGFVVYDYLEN